MAHTSYSIEAEDLILKRPLEAVVFKGPLRKGTFIDIGAFRPIVHSNTHLFYELGWRGINVEPNPEYIPEFMEFRPEDLTLNVGIHAASSKLLYHKFSDGLLNGFLSEPLLESHIAHGYEYLGGVEVDCIGINDLLRTYAKKPVDLLSIDIEMSEESVLKVWDWAACSPTVICAEIHTRTLDDLLQSEIVGILKAAGYLAMSRVFQSAFFVRRDALD